MADTTIDNNTKGRHIDTNTPLESDFAHMHPLVSWRSVVAGLLVAFLAEAILLSLGMAFGGTTIGNASTSAQQAGLFTGIWFLVSSLASLFAGSYFAARISKFHTNRIGSAQGLVIASLFFGFFLWQTVSAIGWAGRAAGSAVSNTASAMSSGLQQATDNPAINDIVENAMGDLRLKSPPQVVVSGVANRLLRGDQEGAKNFLARQAGLSSQQADQKIAQIRGQVDTALTQAREAAAQALKATGWSLFTTLVLGAAAAIGGGALGSRANLRKPLTREQVEAVSDLRTAPV